MKKLIGKKQQGQLNLRQLKRVADAIPEPSKEKPVMKENRVMRKKNKLCELQTNNQAKMSQTNEPKLPNLRLDNPDFSKNDSIILDKDGETLSSGNLDNGSKNTRKDFGKNVETEDVFVNGTGLCKSIIFSQENSVNQLKFEDTLERSYQNSLLKNTEKLTDFSFENCNLMKKHDLQYSAEILRLTDVGESSTDFFRSGVYYNESLFNDIIVMDSQEDGFIKNEKTSPGYKSNKKSNKILQGLNKLIAKRKNRRMGRDFLRKSSFLKSQIITNISIRKEKKKNKSKFRRTKTDKKKNTNLDNVEAKFVDSEVTKEEDLETKQYLRDFFIYTIHLIFITTIALSMVSSTMYYFTDITVSMFFDSKNIIPSNSSIIEKETNTTESYPEKTLRESKTYEDFWAFAESTLIRMLYWDFYDSKMDPAAHTEKDDKKMFYENQILGVARLRQVRVRNDSCPIHPDVQRFFDTCFFYYSVYSEETRPIKEKMENSLTSTAWVYTEATTLGTSYYCGEISFYGGGGYYLDLATTEKEALQMIKELKENYWISRATRVVFIDFNIYNANVNLFCICKIVLEFPPVGGIIPKADFQSLKLIRYLSISDFVILACEFLYILFVIYFTWKAAKAIITQKISFFLSLWNFLDILILTLSYTYIILGVIRYFYAEHLISTINDHYYEYTEFQSLKQMQIVYNNVIAFLVFFCWMKLFMYFNFNIKMLQFKKTLARSLKDILFFIPMFLTMLLAFAFLAYLLFGNQVKDYNTLWYSFMSLLQAFLGDFNYHNIAENNPILGPLFYIAFIFFIFFVLLVCIFFILKNLFIPFQLGIAKLVFCAILHFLKQNVFIAIISDAYTVVKSQVISDKPKIGEYIQRGFFNVGTCFSTRLQKKLFMKDMEKKVLLKEIEGALKKQTTNKTKGRFLSIQGSLFSLPVDSIRSILLTRLVVSRAGFSTTEIKIFFFKYNINYNNFLNENTKRKIIEDLELNRIDITETSEQVQINTLRRRIDKLRDKMEDFELNLQPIVDKVDILLQRL